MQFCSLCIGLNEYLAIDSSNCVVECFLETLSWYLNEQVCQEVKCKVL